MQCNNNSHIQIIKFHELFRNALRCRKTGACRILVPLRYPVFCDTENKQKIKDFGKKTEFTEFMENRIHRIHGKHHF